MNIKAQPDSPAHTVGGACQPPSKKGGYEIGTMWLCPTCKAIWYADEHDWRFLQGSRSIQNLYVTRPLEWTFEHDDQHRTRCTDPTCSDDPNCYVTADGNASDDVTMSREVYEFLLLAAASSSHKP